MESGPTAASRPTVEAIAPMTNPNRVVEAGGEPVDLNRLTSATLSNNELDPDASTFETVTIDAIVSDLSYKDRVRLEGRVDEASLKLTVDSSTDVEATRDFRPDRIRHPAGSSGTIYEVAEVREISHPLAKGIEKKTVYVEPLPGRAAFDGI